MTSPQFLRAASQKYRSLADAIDDHRARDEPLKLADEYDDLAALKEAGEDNI